MMTDKTLNIPPSVLRSFVTLASLRSFTAVARVLGLQQSTISQHLRRLEEAVGRQLVVRDTHSVNLTTDGDAMVEFARQVLEANSRMDRFFSEKKVRSRLRLGISEDFAMSGLKDVLSEFSQLDAEVDIELTVGLSGFLYQRYDAGELDVIFAKRKPGDRRGTVAWREHLVWIGRPDIEIEGNAPVPLVTYAAPSITRTLAISTLECSNRTWRIACSSGSLNGLCAALSAGLGIAAHSQRLLPPGLASIPPDAGLPNLPTIEFVAIGPGKSHKSACKMIDLLLDRRDALAINSDVAIDDHAN